MNRHKKRLSKLWQSVKEQLIHCSHKQKGQGGVTLALLVVLFGSSFAHPMTSTQTTAELTIQDADTETENQSWEEADADVVFWYTDENLSSFFEDCAKAYYEECGTSVQPVCRDSVTFLEDIYTANMEDEAKPDLLLTESGSLEKAVLFGIARRNTAEETYFETFPEIAKTAATYQEQLYGYPLSFDTTVFVYDTESISQKPESIQEIIDLAEESDLGNGIANLVEWNINDGFYDLAFVGGSVSFSLKEQGTSEMMYEESNFQKGLEYLQNLSQIISITPEEIDDDIVVGDFNEGATASAVIDARSMGEITKETAAFSTLPAINEEIKMQSFSETMLLLVNDYGDNADDASDFAVYVTKNCKEQLLEDSGYLPADASDVLDANQAIAYESYVNSRNLPMTMDEGEQLDAIVKQVKSIWTSAL